MQQHIIDITLENFQQVILEGSQTQPVMVCFWAPNHDESALLLASLEKLAIEKNGAFTLAKINCEQDQTIAMQFGVQSIPTSAMFVKGQPADGFAGNKPEQEIRDILDKHLPDEAQLLAEQGIALIGQQDYVQAAEVLQQSLQLKPDVAAVKLALCKALLETQRVAEVESLIASIGLADQDADYQAILAQLELAKEAADTPEIRALEQALAAGADAETQLKLAVQYSQVGRVEEALELLFQLLMKDMNAEDGQVKQRFMDILSSHSGEACVSAYRRKLYSLLY